MRTFVHSLFLFLVFVLAAGCHHEIVDRAPMTAPLSSFKTVNVQFDAASFTKADVDKDDREYFRTRLDHRMSRGLGLTQVDAGAASDLSVRIKVNDYGRTNRGRDVELLLTAELYDNNRRATAGSFDVNINSRKVDDEDDPIDRKLDKGPTQKAIDHAAIKIVEHIKNPKS